MTDPTEPAPAPPRPPGGLRKSILRGIVALPALVTLLNGIAGFASVHYATKDGLGNASMGHLSAAAWLIFVAMVFDALDGRLARMTRRATDFGAQLDSLCDAISFGVAPAVLMVQTVSMALKNQIQPFDIFKPEGSMLGKAVMAIAVLYVCCTVLRLARFNIENAPDVLHHMTFRGLPCPAAAAAVASVVLLFESLTTIQEGWKSAVWLKVTAGSTLPGVTLAVALLMISRFVYPHVVNQLFLGKRSFGYLVRIVGMVIVALIYLQLALALAALAYAASGPARALLRRVRPGRATAGAEQDDQGQTETSHSPELDEEPEEQKGQETERR